jgi:hypothetical protein
MKAQRNIPHTPVRRSLVRRLERRKEHRADKEEVSKIGAKIYKAQKQINIFNKYNIFILNNVRVNLLAMVLGF